jgi:PAS domain S-box-containing protein
MGISHQVENVFQRALRLRQQATATPAQPELLDATMDELYLVLEELRSADEELHEQNEMLRATRREVEVERHRYRTLFEMAPDGYLVTNRSGRIYYANRAATALFHMPHDLLVGKPLLVLVAPDDRQSFQQNLIHLHRHPHWQITFQSRQGDRVVADVTTTYLSSHQAEGGTILWSLREVTPRQPPELPPPAMAQAERERLAADRTAELAHANVQLRQELHQCAQAAQALRHQAALVDLITDAIYVKDPQQRIVFWSRGAEALYGWTAAEVIGKDANQLLTGSTAPPSLRHISGHTWQGEVNHRTVNGQSVTVWSRCTQVQEAEAFPHSTLVINTDITEKKRLDAELRQTQQLESWGTFVRSIAHDLKTLLNQLTVVTQLLIGQLAVADDFTHELLQILESAVSHSVALSQQILSFADDMPTELTCLQVEDVLNEIQRFVQLTFPAEIVVRVRPATGVAPVWAEATLLYRALMNLCVNARDAMPAGGTLTLSVDPVYLDEGHASMNRQAQVGDYVVITVADTGMGIPLKVRDRLFEPFFTTKPRGQGMGIGLAIVATIVSSFRGFIQVSSRDGSGSQFQVYLPAVQQPDGLPPSAATGRH